MPQLGETVSEGKITKWFKPAGDAVKPGDNLFEIETDKMSMEVPATRRRTLSRKSGCDRRGGASRRGGRGDWRRWREAAGGHKPAPVSAARVPPRRSARNPQPRTPAFAGMSVGASRREPVPHARSVPRGAHAGTQFRSGAAAQAAPL